MKYKIRFITYKISTVYFTFSIPLYAGVLITIMDTFIFLFLDKYGIIYERINAISEHILL